ncbi:MAG: YHS domain-containing protein [Candidatus Halalkalibacterium sp. M3_1C_030]|jgi:YHS domain-containing protein
MAHHETCPVSGLQIDDLATAPNMEYEGKTLYFCCPSCQDTFLEDPDHYISGSASHKSGCH